MVQPKIEQLTVIPINVVETYELVHWPKECVQAPTYFQLISTLELYNLYKKDNTYFKPATTKKIERWIANNSVERFEQAACDAEECQMLLMEMADDFVKTNREFPLKWRRQDN